MQLVRAKNDSYTAISNNLFLHSKYSPEREAVRFIIKWEEESFSKESSILIVFEPGLGYLLNKILSYKNYTKIVIIFYSRETYNYCFKNYHFSNIISAWYPGSEMSIDKFLEFNMPESLPEAMDLMEWLPGESCFPVEAKKTKEQFLQYMQILQGNSITTMKFAKRWLLNGLRNYIEQDYSQCINRINDNIVIAASGFSLNYHLADLKKNSDSCFIVALPSSVKALLESGIIPDLIISTDPGYYASYHYRTFPEESNIITTLTSYPWTYNSSIIGLNQNTWIDQLLDPEAKNFKLTIPEMGTVAASAISLMHRVSESNIYIIGLDLCIKGIQEHAEPHSFDILSRLQAQRCLPEIHNRFERVSNLSASFSEGYYYTNSMDTYKKWFTRENFSGRIYRVDSSPVMLPFKNLKKLPDFKKKTKRNTLFYKNTNYPVYRERREKLNRIADDWRARLSDPEGSLLDVIQKLYPRYNTLSDMDKVLHDMNRIVQKVYNL